MMIFYTLFSFSSFLKNEEKWTCHLPAVSDKNDRFLLHYSPAVTKRPAKLIPPVETTNSVVASSTGWSRGLNKKFKYAQQGKQKHNFDLILL